MEPARRHYANHSRHDRVWMVADRTITMMLCLAAACAVATGRPAKARHSPWRSPSRDWVWSESDFPAGVEGSGRMAG